MRRVFACLSVSVLVVVGACSGGDPVEGVWTGSDNRCADVKVFVRDCNGLHARADVPISVPALTQPVARPAGCAICSFKGTAVAKGSSYSFDLAFDYAPPGTVKANSDECTQMVGKYAGSCNLSGTTLDCTLTTGGTIKFIKTTQTTTCNYVTSN